MTSTMGDIQPSQEGVTSIGSIWSLFKEIHAPSICTFVQACPLGMPSVKDKNSHPLLPGPHQQYGTILLPLWQQTNEMNQGCSRWDAYMKLLDGLESSLIVASKVFKHGYRNIHDKALREYIKRTLDPVFRSKGIPAIPF